MAPLEDGGPGPIPASRTRGSSPRPRRCAAAASPTGPGTHDDDRQADVIELGRCDTRAPSLRSNLQSTRSMRKCIDEHRLTQPSFGRRYFWSWSPNSRCPVVGPPPVQEQGQLLAKDEAATYASWFACLAEPMRVRLLHAVAVAGRQVTVGELTEQLGISQSTCSHHVKVLADVGFVVPRREGRTTVVSVNAACCRASRTPPTSSWGSTPPAPAARTTCRATSSSVPSSSATGTTSGASMPRASPPATPPSRPRCPSGTPWRPVGSRAIAGWPRSTARSRAGPRAKPVSTRPVYAGVAETSIYVGEGFRGRGVGKALIHRQVTAGDADGLWTLQTSIFPENRASLNLHHSAGFRTLAIRERIGKQHGVWRDTVLLERRRAVDPDE